MNGFTSIGRRPVLAGMAAAALAAVLKPGMSRAETLDRAPDVLAFDVADSLLDLAALHPLFQRLFGNGAVVDEWFGQTILYSETETLTGSFTPFGRLGAGVLRMLGRIHGVAISDADVAELGRGLGTLPPHPDVPDALRSLKAAGYRLVTLTDVSTATVDAALKTAGLAELFEQHVSAETARRYKPAIEVYRQVAEATRTTLSGICVIASHPWDLIGARAAGCSAALIQRDGVAPLVLAGVRQPQITAPTLTGIAAQLVALKHA